MSLEDIVKKSSGGIYNNAAQIWNHTFFWNCLKPGGGGEPERRAGRGHRRQVGLATPPSRKPSPSRAVGNFGSGWTWLVKKADGSVDIVNMGAAGTPLTTGDKALLTVDVWEHAYYIDYRNAAAEVRRDLPGHAGQLGLRGSATSADACRLQRDRPAMTAGLLVFRRANGAPLQLEAGLDAALGEPALVHLQRVAHRLCRSSASSRTAAACRRG